MFLLLNSISHCSPRWLYSVGKEERARAILAKFHSSTNDINSPLIALEMDEIKEKIEVDGADSKRYPSYFRNGLPI